MATIRVVKDKNFTIMSNYHLRDKRLSFKAMGLMSFMLSVSDDWEYSVNGLAQCAKDKKDSVLSALKELKKYGYLKIENKRNEKGVFQGSVYTIYEKPPCAENPSPHSENPHSENPHSENPHSENPLQRNTNLKKVLNERTTDRKKGEVGKPDIPSHRFKPPCLADVEEYVKEKGYTGFDCERFIDFYESKGWMVGKNKMKDWKAAVRNWARSNKERASGSKSTWNRPDTERSQVVYNLLAKYEAEERMNNGTEEEHTESNSAVADSFY